MDGQRQYHKDLENGMRAHIKQHATEFLDKDQAEDEEEAPTKGEKDENLSEAEVYAAEQRHRRELDSWSLQGGLDHIVSGLKSIGSGVYDIVGSLCDYVQDLPLTKGTLLVGIIFLLLFSNVYTYYAYKSTSKANLRRVKKQMARYGGDDMAEAMRTLLSPEGRQEAMDQARQLRDILDEVERRATNLRQVIVSDTEGIGS